VEEIGGGATARHSREAGVLIAMLNVTTLTSVVTPAAANREPAADASRRCAAAAQQLSACAWVTLSFEE
jgi:hypothetical protein